MRIQLFAFFKKKIGLMISDELCSFEKGFNGSDNNKVLILVIIFYTVTFVSIKIVRFKQ